MLTISRMHRDFVAAWTSLWIFFPVAVWIIQFITENNLRAPSHVPVILLFSGVASIAHWNFNIEHDPLHIIDMVLAWCVLGTLCHCTFIFRSEYLLSTSLFVTTIVCFYLSRTLQRESHIRWKFVLFCFISFRYTSFLLSLVCVVSRYDTGSLLSTLVWTLFLTSLYLLHIFWLVKRAHPL